MLFSVLCVLCVLVRHHCTAYLWPVDGGDSLQIFVVAVTVFNNPSQVVDKGWSLSLDVGQVANNSSL
jgi:hypothetical protein